MKSFRTAGSLATAVAAVMIAAPALCDRHAHIDLASAVAMSSSLDRPLQTPDDVMARKGCKFGQRYSSYYRRCVLWMPLDYT